MTVTFSVDLYLIIFTKLRKKQSCPEEKPHLPKGEYRDSVEYQSRVAESPLNLKDCCSEKNCHHDLNRNNAVTDSESEHKKGKEAHIVSHLAQ